MILTGIKAAPATAQELA